MTDQQSSYRQIFKATSLFGGVQVFNILISLVRSKFIAVLLGTQGLGLMGLLQNTIGLIGSLTGLGIGFSAVRDISEAAGTNDNSRISRVITSFRRWVWFTGLLGVAVTLLMAPWLSQWTFGNRDYTIAFIWLSCTLLLGALSSGQNALLQGMRRLKQMAKASIIGSVTGLVISLPLYYWFGLKGIVPTLIITALATLVIAWLFARKIKIEPNEISFQTSMYDGFGMVKLGVMLTLSGFIGTLVSYLVNAYISRTGGLGDVGLYQGGMSITDKYVGLIFAAMATDYYPRLAAINKDPIKVKQIVNQQAEIALLIIGPVLIILLTTIPILIRLLYTKEFMPIVGFVQLVVLGMPLKAASWSIAFIILAKGNSKLFFYTELVTNSILLLLNILGYHFWGLQGLGISFVVLYLIYLPLILIIVSKKYNFSFSRDFIKIFIIQLTGCIIAFLFARYAGYPWAYLSGAILFLIIGWYSWHELDKFMNLNVFLAKKLNIKNE